MSLRTPGEATCSFFGSTHLVMELCSAKKRKTGGEADGHVELAGFKEGDWTAESTG